MASVPPFHRPTNRTALLKVIDADPATQGLGLAMIDDGRLCRIRPQGDNGATVVIELRSRWATIPPLLRIPAATGSGPSVGTVAQVPARASRLRTASTSPATEWLNLGFNCSGAVLAWIGVVGLTSLAPVTGGISGIGAAFLYGGALAASSQCVVSTYRTANIYRGRTDINDKMDQSAFYHRYSLIADGIGLLGAGGAIKELKFAHTAIVESGVGWRAARQIGMSRPVRRRLTIALELQGAKRVQGHLINRLVRQRMLDGFAAALGLVASSTSGLIKEAVVWITDETQGFAHAP